MAIFSKVMGQDDDIQPLPLVTHPEEFDSIESSIIGEKKCHEIY